MKSPKHVVSILVALTLAAMLSGCSKNTTPTGLDPALELAGVVRRPGSAPASWLKQSLCMHRSTRS